MKRPHSHDHGWTPGGRLGRTNDSTTPPPEHTRKKRPPRKHATTKWTRCTSRTRWRNAGIIGGMDDGGTGGAGGTFDADLAIAGGGAAGLMAAIAAGEARPGARVVVLEAAKDTGRKILVSGGGRCNVLPMRHAPERFVSASPPRLVRRFLDRFPLAEQRAFFEALLGAPLREEPETRKLFPPTNRSKDVRDALAARARAAGAEIRTGAPVRGAERLEGGGLALTTDAGVVRARRAILATGGLSVLAGGADAKGLDWARALGHTIRPTYAALAPITATGAPHAALAGISLRARVVAEADGERAASEGGFLFTHRGYSGPAVLDVSHVVETAVSRAAAARVSVTFRPENAPPDWDAYLREPGGNLATRLARVLPERLADTLLAAAAVADVPLHRLAREDRKRLVDVLAAWTLPADGTEGYRTAEVTGGGVALEEVDPGSGRSRIVPDLYLAGEILDAFGPIGGFNFQWAWATGRTAGLAAAVN